MSNGDYRFYKSQGLCPRCHRVDIKPGGRAFCPECTKKNCQDQRAYRKRHRKRVIASKQAVRTYCSAIGVCHQCKEGLLVTETRCERCRQLNNKAQRRNRHKRCGPPKRPYHCSMCGGAGHDPRTCTNRGYDLPSIDEFASRRDSE